MAAQVSGIYLLMGDPEGTDNCTSPHAQSHLLGPTRPGVQSTAVRAHTCSPPTQLQGPGPPWPDLSAHIAVSVLETVCKFT